MTISNVKYYLPWALLCCMWFFQLWKVMSMVETRRVHYEIWIVTIFMWCYLFWALSLRHRATMKYPVEVEQIMDVDRRVEIFREMRRSESRSPARPPLGGVVPCDDPEKSCRVCMVNEKNYLAIPCGHLLMCAECVAKIPNSDCLICSRPTSNWQRLYDT
jgi:hypothetical protein